MTQISDNVYFTDQPFTQDEFADIMKGFAGIRPDGAAKTYGLAMEKIASSYANKDEFSNLDNYSSISSLLGMFGLNYVTADDNGSFAYTAETDAYKNLLQFVQSLAADGDILSTTDPNTSFKNGIVGWTNSASISDAMLSSVLRASAELLIAPPEIGESGQSGVSVMTGPQFGNVLCVNANVSDEELAVILQIYDALSYDPDLWLESNYGKEGTDWKWSGAPYESAVTEINYGYTFFSTGVSDSMLGDFTYAAAFNPVIAEYMRNNGERLALRPASPGDYVDVTGEMQNQAAQYDPDGTKWSAYCKLVRSYMANVASGASDVNSTWNDYVKSIDDAYISQYYQIYGLR